MLFGAVAAGQANIFGTDLGKAKEAAKSIFFLVDTPTEINPLEIPEEAV